MPCVSASHAMHPLYRSIRSIAFILFLCTTLISTNGCSLFVMAGKMFLGDPMIGDDFGNFTQKPMTDGKSKVAILCSVFESIKDYDAGLQIELFNEISRKMSIHEINIIKPHLVARWIDDNGGQIDDLEGLAEEVEADYIVNIEVTQFSYREENSPNLFRGRCDGKVTVFEYPHEESSEKPSGPGKQVYEKSFKSTHPTHQPVPADQTSELIFRKKFINRVGDEIARMFFKHRAGSDF